MSDLTWFAPGKISERARLGRLSPDQIYPLNDHEPLSGPLPA